MKYIGKQKRIKGLTLYEFNRLTKEIKPAEYTKSLTGIRVIIKEQCFYLQALNIQNAKRKLINLKMIQP